MKKILAKIKKFFKENYKAIIILIFIYALFNYKLDVSIYTPGGLVNLNNRIVSEDKIYDSSGTINMTYVSMLRGTIPTYLAAKIIPTWDIVKNDDITYDGNMEETIKIDRLFMQESISIAYAIAFEKANMPYTIKSSNNYIVY